MKIRDIAPYGVRLPAELKERLQVSAKRNGRSLNSEIVTRLIASYINDEDSGRLLADAEPGSFSAHAQETLRKVAIERTPEIVEMLAKKIMTQEFEEELKRSAREQAQKFIEETQRKKQDK